MKEPINSIILYRGKGKRGSEISCSKYESLCSFILTNLSHRQFLTVSQLLDLSFEKFADEDRNSFSRELFAVKQDLEVRGLINVAFDPTRTQYITLSRKSKILPQLLNEKTNNGARKF
jgi:hypothetical protein